MKSFSAMRKTINEFIVKDTGATLLEYGIALIVAIVIGGSGLSILGAEVSSNMTEAKSELPTSS